MSMRTLCLAALAISSVSIAHATVVFDNLPPTVAQYGISGTSIETVMGDSFTAAIAPNSVDLELSATSAVGSALVYLVPDDGSGLVTGVAGVPVAVIDGGAATDFSSSELIGTIAAASLTTSPSLVTLAIPADITTDNDEYWVVVDDNGSNIGWSYAEDGSGTGTANQGYLNNNGANLLPVYPDSAGPYQMEVDAPEPATLGLLGAGIAALGYLRRRKAKTS